MKSRITIIFILLSFVTFGNESDLNSLIKKRTKFATEYQNIKDSVISSRSWKNFLLVQKSDSIIEIGNSIISLSVDYMTRYDSLGKEMASISKTNLALKGENDQLSSRTVNDMQMLLILKVAIAILIMGLLIAIYYIYKLKSESNRSSKYYLPEVQAQNKILMSKLQETESQLAVAREKNNSILYKINKLISDLSNIN